MLELRIRNVCDNTCANIKAVDEEGTHVLTVNIRKVGDELSVDVVGVGCQEVTPKMITPYVYTMKVG